MFDAVVDIEVVIIKKEPPVHNCVLVKLVTEAGGPAVRSVEQRKWAALNGEPINIFADAKQEAIIEKLQTGAILLKELCDVTVGMKPYQVGKGIPKQTRSVVENRIFDATTQKTKSYRPLLRGCYVLSYLSSDVLLWLAGGLANLDGLGGPRGDVVEAQEKRAALVARAWEVHRLAVG